MPLTLTELFRTLASFAPPKADLRGAPFEAYVEWAIAQGLAPLAAYNLEYRATLSGCPEWVQDKLLAVYQGIANDNVMKLVNFKRAIDELEGRKVVLLGGAAFAERLYPHVAFRPVDDIKLLVPPGDVQGLVGFLRHAQFKPLGMPTASRASLSDGNTVVHVSSVATSEPSVDAQMLARSERMPVMGSSVFRLTPEDSVLALACGLQTVGFEAPMLEFIDLRELLLGSPSTGALAAPPDPQKVQALTKQARAEKAVWASLSIVKSLFPEIDVEPFLPSLGLATREVLSRLVVAPVATVGRTEGLQGEEILRMWVS
jgi:hypothetical protein